MVRLRQSSLGLSRTSFFCGKLYLDRLDQLMRGASVHIDKCIPKKGATAEIDDQVSLNGLRPMGVPIVPP